uniref:Uncharacterized protein n=1 Tax=Clastoptera arizonana TaxID=38151 RepID=A0A1B6D5A5_9HEMI
MKIYLFICVFLILRVVDGQWLLSQFGSAGDSFKELLRQGKDKIFSHGHHDPHADKGPGYGQHADKGHGSGPHSGYGPVSGPHSDKGPVSGPHSVNGPPEPDDINSKPKNSDIVFKNDFKDTCEKTCTKKISQSCPNIANPACIKRHINCTRDCNQYAKFLSPSAGTGCEQLCAKGCTTNCPRDMKCLRRCENTLKKYRSIDTLGHITDQCNHECTDECYDRCTEHGLVDGQCYDQCEKYCMEEECRQQSFLGGFDKMYSLVH